MSQSNVSTVIESSQESSLILSGNSSVLSESSSGPTPSVVTPLSSQDVISSMTSPTTQQRRLETPRESLPETIADDEGNEEEEEEEEKEEEEVKVAATADATEAALNEKTTGKKRQAGMEDEVGPSSKSLRRAESPVVFEVGESSSSVEESLQHLQTTPPMDEEHQNIYQSELQESASAPLRRSGMRSAAAEDMQLENASQDRPMNIRIPQGVPYSANIKERPLRELPPIFWRIKVMEAYAFGARED